MKLAIFESQRIGVIDGNEIIDVTEPVRETGVLQSPDPMIDVITNFDLARDVLRDCCETSPRRPLADIRLRAPITRPGKIIAMGSNYLEGTEFPPLPIWAFFKSPNAIIGPGETVVLPSANARIFHHEAELVAVIGKTGKNLTRDEAPRCVFGFTTGIDVSGRFPILTQSIFNKSHDTFAPIGPYVVTADEIPDPHDLQIRLNVDGVERQNFNTSDMGHDIWDSISYISGVTRLEPGDLIFTGTNHQGLGPLQDGESASIEIERIGCMTVNVIDPERRSWPKGIDREIGERVIKMLSEGTPPGAR